MDIVLLEPFFGGSHQRWAEDYQRYSSHHVQLLTLSASHWKWRMHGGAISLAQKYLQLGIKADLIVATDMLDLSIFLSLTKSATHDIPTAIYFHENQLTYPWSPTDKDVQLKRDNHYSFINYTSALVADKVLFNSAYHQQVFIKELSPFLSAFPDHQPTDTIQQIADKSEVLHLGMDLALIQKTRPTYIERPERAVIGWNHRWEYDKNPEDFFRALRMLADRGIDFRVVVLGQGFANQPACFQQFKDDYGDRILHYGFAGDYNEYINWLCHCDILPVTAYHDFFGLSVVEAMSCDVVPLLPYRMAYPEHIPERFHRTFFYHDFDEMVNRLQRLIMDVRVLRPQKLAHFVQKYDWSVMAPKYDVLFESLQD